jgi:hypothetical protein
VSLHRAVQADELVWCEIRPARGKPRERKLAVVYDPGWLVRDTTAAKLAHENAWIEVIIDGKITQVDPTYVRKTSLLEKIAWGGRR